ncbi:hypothetical protein ACFL4L_07160, partial [bacterium]
MNPGKNCLIKLTTLSGEKTSILLLTEEEARTTYEFNILGQQTFVMTNHLAFYNDVMKELEIRSMGENEFEFYTCPEILMSSEKVQFKGLNGSFTKYKITLPTYQIPEITATDISDRSAFIQYCKSLNKQTPEGPAYSHLMEKQSSYLRYELNLPKTLPTEINDLLVLLDYSGNTAQIYADNLIIADDYYSEPSMP